MRLNIAGRLLIWLLLLGMLPLLIYGVLSFRQFEQTLKAETLSKLDALTNGQVQHVESYVQELNREINTLSQMPDVLSAMLEINEAYGRFGAESLEYAKAQRTFSQFANHYQKNLGYHDFFLINKEGIVVFSLNHHREFGSNLKSGPYRESNLSSVFMHSQESLQPNVSAFKVRSEIADEPSIFTAAPLVKEGRAEGVVALQATSSAIELLSQDYSGLGQTGEIVLASLVGDAAMVVAPLRHDAGAAFKRKMIIGSSEGVPIQEATQGRPGTGLSVDYRGKKILASWRYLPELELGLVVKVDTDEAYMPFTTMRRQSLILGFLSLLVLSLFALFLARTFSTPIKKLTRVTKRLTDGDLNQTVRMQRSDEIGLLAYGFNEMAAKLRENQVELDKQDWLKSGLAQLNDVMRGDPGIKKLSVNVISAMTQYLDATVGAFYVLDVAPGKPGTKGTGTVRLSLTGSYALKKLDNLCDTFELGEGLVGQAARDGQQIMLRNVPDDYFKVVSGLGERVPKFICITPFSYENEIRGVVEIGTLHEVTDLQSEYIEQAMLLLAVAVESAQGRSRLAQSLEDAQDMSEELQSQQEELRASNEELEEKSQRLEESEERLKRQQGELQVVNEELIEKNESLEREKDNVESARNELAEKAQNLAMASKYKSEFLANMSHELRTPLNSLLLLSQSLSKNKDKNLTEEQLDSIKIIYGSGSDLLNLINEILDLSRIESGRMDLQLEQVQVNEIADGIKASFKHMAEEKNLSLKIRLDDDVPQSLTTDHKRLVQIIRNLVSNAVKFTHNGGISITFGRPLSSDKLTKSGLTADDCLAVSVKDTGIGISENQILAIFEAFQQADGSTARKYGGTGLGLAISRQLAKALGGEIQLESEPGEGSTFTLYLPITNSGAQSFSRHARTSEKPANRGKTAFNDARAMKKPAVQIADDRDDSGKDDQLILVIEDDPNFSRLLRDKCHKKGFKCLLTPTGEEGLDLAIKHLPTAVLLDISLPGMDGWAVLAELKDNIQTRHIPVHVVSAEDETVRAVKSGAVGHAVKPLSLEALEDAFCKLEEVATSEKKNVLVVEDDPDIRRETVKLIRASDVNVHEVGTGKQAMDALRSGSFACVVLDLTLPDINGDQLIKKLESEGVKLPPIIVHTARDVSREDEMTLRAHEGAVVIKDVRSQERLLDEVSLFLHRLVSEMPEEKRNIISALHDSQEILLDKKVLVVDDDMRTIFAMSRLLADRDLKPLKAENGQKALRLLEQHPDIAVVLMDIMMPVMDGYETIKRIRADQRFRNLPIIALTAKAMPEDREKCLAAGANDYLAKPVDEGRLISMIRVWLQR